MLFLLSIGLVVAQMILDDANELALWINWLFAGVFSAGIWHVTKRYHLCGIYDGKSFTISWPILSASLNFSLCHFPNTEHFYIGILSLMAMLVALSLLLSVWQEEQSAGRHMLVGIIIGLVSTLLPHALMWLFLLPLVTYHMRSWSLRNIFSTLTGAVLGIWIVYCSLFLREELVGGYTEGSMWMQSGQIIRNYAYIINFESYEQLIEGFGLWHWLFLGLIALLVLVYSISAMFLNVGNSIRAGASISLVSTLSLFLVVLSFFDIAHLSIYLSLLSFFLCIQLTIHQANLRTSLNEWWTLIVIISMMALTALPLFINFKGL